VHPYIQDLHEATELDHRRDDPMEGLPDPLTQIGTLEESRDIAISFVGALLQLRIRLTQGIQLIGAILDGRSAGCSDERLQRAMNDKVRVSPNRRGEMRVM